MRFGPKQEKPSGRLLVSHQASHSARRTPIRSAARECNYCAEIMALNAWRLAGLGVGNVPRCPMDLAHGNAPKRPMGNSRYLSDSAPMRTRRSREDDGHSAFHTVSHAVPTRV